MQASAFAAIYMRFLAFCPVLMGFTVLKTEAEDLARELFSIAMEIVEDERRQKKRTSGCTSDPRAAA